MTDGIRIGIFGRSGSGKSCLMNEMIDNRDPERLVLMDYLPTRKGWADENGLEKVTTIEEIKAYFSDDYVNGFKLWYKPPINDQIKALHELSTFIWHTQTQLEELDCMEPITLAIDEMSDSYPVEKLPSSLNGFNRLCKAGRHYRINLIGATQRPAQVSTEFRGNLDERYFLSLTEPADLRAVANTLGKDMVEAVQCLQPLQFIRQADGQITEGNTRF